MRIKFRFGASTTVLEISQNFFFREVASNHFKQKNINVDLDEYCFKVPNYDFFLGMDDSINDFLAVAWVFQDRENEDELAPLVLIRNAEKSDAVQRETSTIDPTQEASLCVWAWKRGSSTGGILAGFKRRYFVLQSNTLYYSESPGSSVLGYIPCCGLHLSLRPDITYKDKIVFEVGTSLRGTRSYILAADQVEFSQLQQTIDDLQLRRVKSASVTICQALLHRGVDSMQGLFRLSGEKSQVEYLRHQYELSLDPELSEIPNETLAGVVKLYLRQLEVPIISFGLYNEFLRIGKLSPGVERTEAANMALSRLPTSQRRFLHYLCHFLSVVASYSHLNLMNSKNLAIVIGPNLLRPQKETTQTAMSDNQYVLSVVQLLIEQQAQLFGPVPDMTLPDTAETQQVIRQRTSTVSARAAAISPTSISQNNRSDLSLPPIRASRMSISEIDPSYGYVQDLKNAMNSSKVLGAKIELLQTKHLDIMQRWQDLIRAIKQNPQGTYPLLEFIMSQSNVDIRWLDEGVARLDDINNNLYELVELLGGTNNPTSPETKTPAAPPTINGLVSSSSQASLGALTRGPATSHVPPLLTPATPSHSGVPPTPSSAGHLPIPPPPAGVHPSHSQSQHSSAHTPSPSSSTGPMPYQSTTGRTTMFSNPLQSAAPSSSGVHPPLTLPPSPRVSAAPPPPPPKTPNNRSRAPSMLAPGDDSDDDDEDDDDVPPPPPPLNEDY